MLHFNLNHSKLSRATKTIRKKNTIDSMNSILTSPNRSTASKHIIGQPLLFDNYLVEQRENGNIYIVVYFIEDDFAQYYRALESVMIKISRACPCIPNTWNIVNGDKLFLAVKASSVDTDMFAHVCVKLCSNVAHGVVTAHSTPPKPKPNRNRQSSTHIGHD